MKMTLVTGGKDPPYVLPLVRALADKGTVVDFLADEEMATPEILTNGNIHFLQVYQFADETAKLAQKLLRIIKTYLNLLRYCVCTDAQLFHLQWENKVVFFDRTVLNLFYKLLGKKLVYTAHNVNAGERDGSDSALNRFSLKFLYSIVDGIIVHTEKMRDELAASFKIRRDKVAVLPFGINDTAPITELSARDAKARLGLNGVHKTLLFFGNITRYKGLLHLVRALALLKPTGPNYRLIVAGRIKKGADDYWQEIDQAIARNDLHEFIIERTEYIPDADIELYFKAADLLVLPYTHIFQSGVLFLSYYFGLPVIVSDVGSLRDDVLEGKTGLVCKPEDPQDLAAAIERYFASDMYTNLASTRQEISRFAQERYSWGAIAERTREVYGWVMGG